jgi:hypothetical protein
MYIKLFSNQAPERDSDIFGGSSGKVLEQLLTALEEELKPIRQLRITPSIFVSDCLPDPEKGRWE